MKLKDLDIKKYINSDYLETSIYDLNQIDTILLALSYCSLWYLKTEVGADVNKLIDKINIDNLIETEVSSEVFIKKVIDYYNGTNIFERIKEDIEIYKDYIKPYNPLKGLSPSWGTYDQMGLCEDIDHF
jgi:hypothetical protein